MTKLLRTRLLSVDIGLPRANSSSAMQASRARPRFWFRSVAFAITCGPYSDSASIFILTYVKRMGGEQS